jgi:Na+-transporting methylmalonyl-CoA/oxaloacetate decarboxylase gamma subunit
LIDPVFFVSYLLLIILFLYVEFCSKVVDRNEKEVEENDGQLEQLDIYDFMYWMV